MDPEQQEANGVLSGARESTGLIEFLNANSEDIDDAVIARVLSMKVGESDDMGGGATAAFPMTRVI
jgi:hypothetical protein